MNVRRFFMPDDQSKFPLPWGTTEQAAMYSQCLHPEKGGFAT